MINKAVQDGVVIVFEDTTPKAIIIKNGTPKWYKIEEVGWGDMVELLDANQPLQNE